MSAAKGARVWVGEVKTTEDPKISQGRLYELNSESYETPWELEPGTVLQVVSTPERDK